MCLLLLLLQSFYGAQAAPAAVDPASLSLNTIIAPNLRTIPSLSSEESINALALFLNTSNPAGIVLYRVPDTSTLLRIGLQDNPIQKPNIGRTILRTQQSLAAFIKAYDADDTPLARLDDPYESDIRYSGCFFGVATFPIGYHHLTYGIVMNVLQGLWLYLYRAGRFQMAAFEVRDDQFGTVGVGKITPDRPDGLVLGMVGAGNGSVS
ncbi:hypothetical protein HO133_000064 [Letharia lupina]|uniref:Uncharacterized protein n=1 Tax=Letharia lupina TaxID=560253 RepID=A0A8H6FCC0_9LECA|nr:uncharacterized protein HO133_000064 [Letharia lupina]KAF6223222.1 hypothetical protein HO133_000064 [Letharia lupina]